MFEFDQKSNMISPSNFIIISTAIARNKTADRKMSSSSHGDGRHGALSDLGDLSNNATEEPPKKTQKSFAEMQEEYRSHRLLSAVAEDCQGEDNGSMSMKKHPLRQLLQAADHTDLLMEPIAENGADAEDSPEITATPNEKDNEQENFFCDDKNTPFSELDKDDVTMPNVDLVAA